MTQKDGSSLHQSSTHDLKQDDLKGVTGGELSNLVEENADQLWTSAGIHVVDKFLTSSFHHA